ncbi:helix-turn-helix transcriptional regulator [Nocardia otitidiscaviarum]|nr:helix-turn-helix transcriptional regulator [Nocardia otitidiscaviarum]
MFERHVVSCVGPYGRSVRGSYDRIAAGSPHLRSRRLRVLSAVLVTATLRRPFVAHQTVGYASAELLGSCRRPDPAPGPDCPVELTLAVLRGRWTPLIVGELVHGPRGFSDLARALPSLSDKVLSDRLTHLTGAGVIERRRTPGWPARVCYTLTERGHALVPVLQALWDWGSRPR